MTPSSGLVGIRLFIFGTLALGEEGCIFLHSRLDSGLEFWALTNEMVFAPAVEAGSLIPGPLFGGPFELVELSLVVVPLVPILSGGLGPNPSSGGAILLGLSGEDFCSPDVMDYVKDSLEGGRVGLDDPVFVIPVPHTLYEAHDLPPCVDLDVGEGQGRLQDLPLLDVVEQGIPLLHPGKHPFQPIIMIGWDITCHHTFIEEVPFGDISVPEFSIHPGLHLFGHISPGIGGIFFRGYFALVQVPKELVEPVIGI